MAEHESRPARRSRPAATVAQLRGDIDRGRTGDKVSAPDPALSPLGTDDEAAGTPPGPRAIDMARREEGKAQAGDEPASSPRMQHSYGFVLALALLILLALIVIVWVTGHSR